LSYDVKIYFFHGYFKKIRLDLNLSHENIFINLHENIYKGKLKNELKYKDKLKEIKIIGIDLRRGQKYKDILS
jgi:hypothetical protein